MTISSLSRRDFLKKGSIGTAALFVGLNSNGVLAAALSSSGEVMVNPFVKIEANGVVMDPNFKDLSKQDYTIKNKKLLKQNLRFKQIIFIPIINIFIKLKPSP